MEYTIIGYYVLVW